MDSLGFILADGFAWCGAFRAAGSSLGFEEEPSPNHGNRQLVLGAPEKTHGLILSSIFCFCLPSSLIHILMDSFSLAFLRASLWVLFNWPALGARKIYPVANEDPSLSLPMDPSSLFRGRYTVKEMSVRNPLLPHSGYLLPK